MVNNGAIFNFGNPQLPITNIGSSPVKATQREQIKFYLKAPILWNTGKQIYNSCSSKLVKIPQEHVVLQTPP